MTRPSFSLEKRIVSENRKGSTEASCLFTRLGESSLVPAGFLKAQFSAENVIYEAFFCGKLAGASFTAFLGLRGSIEKLEG